MVAGRQKKAQKKKASAGPMVMEVQDCTQSLPEVPLHRQPAPGGPRMESSAMEIILQLFREVSKGTKQLLAGQDSLLSEVAEIKTSIGQMNQWLDLAESRFSSLEDRACETHQTNSIVSISQSDPVGGPAASSSSFGSPQVLLGAAQAAASPPSGCPGDASSEPALPSSSEQFRAASGALVYSETEEKALQMLAEAWSQERTSVGETAQGEAEESGQQEDTFSGESLLSAPECKTERQPLTSTEEKAGQPSDALSSQEKSSENQSDDTEVGASGEQEDTSHGASPQEYKPEQQPSTSNLPGTPPSLSAAEMENATSLTATRSSRGRPANKRSSSSASTSSATSAGALGPLASSPPAEATSPASHPRASIAWRYFSKCPTSKFIATCNVCGADVKTGKVGGCGKVGTSALLHHLKRIHHITSRKKLPSVLPSAIKGRPRRTGSAASASASTSKAAHRSPASSAPTETMSPPKHPRASVAWRYFAKCPSSKFIATCKVCGVDVKTGKVGGCGKVGTSALLHHLKRVHCIVVK
ncbi:uncharacterized protein LOC143834298 [Paroedura picta]|uniref:uncharacterized protein LOC143834298 n=1 Tax=Paroedura picta TaxID=143630 RepID=UPI0040572CCC